MKFLANMPPIHTRRCMMKFLRAKSMERGGGGNFQQIGFCHNWRKIDRPAKVIGAQHEVRGLAL
jgi:hypothetical protein